MDGGRIVEQGPPGKILKVQQHETTRQLLAAVPRIIRPALPAVEQ